jgi:hypothetical protein
MGAEAKAFVRNIIPREGTAGGYYDDFSKARAFVLSQVAGDQEACDRKLLAVGTEVSELLEQEWDLVEALVEALLTHTTLTGKQIAAILGAKA